MTDALDHQVRKTLRRRRRSRLFPIAVIVFAVDGSAPRSAIRRLLKSKRTSSLTASLKKKVLRLATKNSIRNYRWLHFSHANLTKLSVSV